MKVTSIVFAALLAVASAEAAAAPQSAEEICNLPGQPCNKMKRAAEAIAEAIAEPEADARRKYNPHFRFCHRRGEACAKAKRDALELAEAVADADASANQEPELGESFSLPSTHP